MRVKQKKQEVTRLGAALRLLGGLGGQAVGGLFGQPSSGGAVGTSLGASVSRWLGSGDYVVAENSIVQRVQRGSDAIPMMHTEGQTIVVRHKEFVSEIRGSTAFRQTRFFPLQPGDSNTFPWLSTLASKFQQYRVKGMVFHYVPTSGFAVSGTNPALGSVMMQTSYRSNDNGPLSKVEMMNEYWASEASPAESFCHPIECSPKENPFSIHYVRTNPVPASDSPLMYDLGTTYVATSGMPATDNVVGDLWVTYEIELSKPVVVSSVSDDTLTNFLNFTSPVPANWFATASATSGNLGAVGAVNTITFPIGETGTFLITIDIAAATVFTAGDLSGTPSFTNCTAAAVDAAGLTYYRTVATASSVSRLTYVCGVTISDPSVVASVTMPAGAWTGTASTTRVAITLV